MNNLAWS